MLLHQCFVPLNKISVKKGCSGYQKFQNRFVVWIMLQIANTIHEPWHLNYQVLILQTDYRCTSSLIIYCFISINHFTLYLIGLSNPGVLLATQFRPASHTIIHPPYPFFKRRYQNQFIDQDAGTLRHTGKINCKSTSFVPTELITQPIFVFSFDSR